MNDNELRDLFEKMVSRKIVGTQFGSIELPIAALDAYHKAAGFSDEQLCVLHMRLPNSQDGLYNWALDGGYDAEDFMVSVEQAFFYDDKKEESEDIQCDRLFEEFVIDKLADGEASICGAVAVDHWGRLWLTVMVTDNLGAQICIEFKPDGAGFAISMTNGGFAGRMWFDGEKFYYAPIFRFVVDSDGEPTEAID